MGGGGDGGGEEHFTELSKPQLMALCVTQS